MFLKASIKSAEITQDSKGTISKICIVVEVRDDSTPELLTFDHVIDGTELEAIRTNIKTGVQSIVKSVVGEKYPAWISTIQSVPTVTKLNPIQIATQLGGDITTLN